jgi:type VI secretion system protein ImpM
VYGKLPCFGDFVVRRLPGEFTDVWDGWLQRGMAGLRDRLGGRWLEFYRVAPVWRFLLTPGIAGNSGWAGVLTPSVDRVGRYFPLTLAAPVSASMDAPASLIGMTGWFDSIEPLARRALTVSLDFEHWDLQLRGAGTAPWIAAQDCLEQTIPLPRSRVPLLRVFLPPGSSADLQVDLWRASLSLVSEPACLWSSYDQDEGEICLVSQGLPGAEAFCSLIDLSWEPRGWVRKRLGCGRVPEDAPAQAAPGGTNGVSHGDGVSNGY